MLRRKLIVLLGRAREELVLLTQVCGRGERVRVRGALRRGQGFPLPVMDDGLEFQVEGVEMRGPGRFEGEGGGRAKGGGREERWGGREQEEAQRREGLGLDIEVEGGRADGGCCAGAAGGEISSALTACICRFALVGLWIPYLAACRLSSTSRSASSRARIVSLSPPASPLESSVSRCPVS